MILAAWTAHPARRRPRDVVLVAAVTLLTAGAVLASLESAWLSLLSVIILLVATAPFLLPTRYTITDLGIEEQRGLRRRARRWADLRRLQVGREAALVSPFARPNWLDRYRGLIVLLDGADRDEVVGILKARVRGDA